MPARSDDQRAGSRFLDPVNELLEWVADRDPAMHVVSGPDGIRDMRLQPPLGFLDNLTTVDVDHALEILDGRFFEDVKTN